MIQKAFINGLANSQTDVIQTLLNFIHEHNIRYCVIGGLAVNAYVEPVVSLDLDLVIAAAELEKFDRITQYDFQLKKFPVSTELFTSLPCATR